MLSGNSFAYWKGRLVHDPSLRLLADWVLADVETREGQDAEAEEGYHRAIKGYTEIGERLSAAVERALVHAVAAVIEELRS